MPIKVLIVDDSALMRHLLTDVLRGAPDIEVVGTAADPYAARELIKTLNPDVLTLDIEMPRMDGLSFLERLMALRPMPVIVVSTLTHKGTDTALRAMELGAIDCVAKPSTDVRTGLASLSSELIGQVRSAAGARVRPLRSAATAAVTPARQRPAAGRIVAMGASTGGVEALSEVLEKLPADCPAILVTQHMRPGFAASFARRLDSRCAMSVRIAEDGGPVTDGHVYLAGDGHHLRLEKAGPRYICRLDNAPRVSGHQPSVDVLFSSFADAAGSNAVGIVLTGMGRDGAQGLLRMRKAGARTIGQDEASCVVYGMPAAAKAIGPWKSNSRSKGFGNTSWLRLTAGQPEPGCDEDVVPC